MTPLRGGRRGELGVEVDVDGAGEVAREVVLAAVRVAERPADVEQHHPPPSASNSAAETSTFMASL